MPENGISSALGQVAVASDFVIAGSFNELAAKLNERFSASSDDLAATLPSELRFMDGESMLGFFDRNAHRELDDESSLRIARQLFALAAANEETAPIVSETLSGFRDNRQMVGEILAIGVVGAVWLIVASTSFSFRTPAGTIKKQKVSASVIQAFAELARAIRGGAEKKD